jgi:FKBP-type peptidyl-prolyl cis-trans isomerase FkpA
MNARWITKTAVALAIAGSATACEYGPTDDVVRNIPYQQVDLRLGTGQIVEPGQEITIHTQAWVYSNLPADHKGTQVITTIGGNPVPVLLDPLVSPGLLQGIPGMRVGGLRLLVLPPDLAVGIGGNLGGIPPDATIIIEIEVVEILV